METKNAPYGWLVKRIAHRLEQNMNHFLKPYNITIMQSWILLFLKKTEASYTYKELEKEFEISQPTMAGLLARLNQKNMILISQDEKDKRIKRVRISDDGSALMERLKAYLDDSECEIIGNFSQEEQETFHVLLEKAYYNVVERGDEND